MFCNLSFIKLKLFKLNYILRTNYTVFRIILTRDDLAGIDSEELAVKTSVLSKFHF